MNIPYHRRISTLAALVAAAISSQLGLPAQTSSSPAAADNGQIVQMSAFQVTTTQGHGYVSTNSASAFKTNESLMDIPQGDIVVTNDLIKDLGAANTSDVLAYFGLAAGFQGENTKLRGVSVGYPYIDDMPAQTPYMDNAIVDSYEVIKGPTQSLYINAPLPGIVLKATKKPLPFHQDIVSAQVDQFGLYRFMGDSSGPIGKVGDAKLSYRFVGVWQAGNSYWQNVKNDTNLIYPVLQVDYHNTTVRLMYDLQRLTDSTGAMCLLTPTGNVYTGAGRDCGNQPPNNAVFRAVTVPEIQALQKISDSWENRVMAMYEHNIVYGGNVEVTGYNWGQQTETFLSEIYNQNWKYWAVVDDTTGKYTIGPSNWEMKCVDAFGWGYTSWTNKLQYWTTAPFYNNGTLVVPFNNAAAINAIVVPPSSAYTPPANQGSLTETFLSSIYFQHSMDVIPNWLNLTAAFTWDNVNSNQIGNISTLPFNGNTITTHAWLHRLGAVFHVTKGISIYALHSTAFTPPSGTTLLQNGQLPPNVAGTGQELGAKWSLLGGRISGEAAWFKLASNNTTITGGLLANGFPYLLAVGNAVAEGVDGDAAFTIMPGWQLIGTWYAGHKFASTSSLPVAGTYNNSWSMFTRYEVRTGALRGLAVGGGITRIGSIWGNLSGISNVPGGLPRGNLIKLKPGNLVNLFGVYDVSKHLAVRVACANVLNEIYPIAAQAAYFVDPSTPTAFTFQGIYKF